MQDNTFFIELERITCVSKKKLGFNEETSNFVGEFDVVVVGGGAAGVAAAETAARNGLKTAIIEKNGFFGGQAVAGLSATICGLYATNEQWTKENGPNQIVFGFAEKFKKKLEENNGITAPQLYGNTYVNAHEALAWKMSAEQLLSDAGVTIFYHSTLIGVEKEVETVKELTFYTTEGFCKIKANAFIDASGDAALVAQAGGQFYYGADGVVQNPTLIFKLNHIEEQAFWTYFGENTICNDDFSDKIKEAEKTFGYNLPRKKIWVFRCVHDGQVYVNATSVAMADGSSLNCISAENRSYAEKKARQQAMEYVAFMKKYIPGCENAYISEHGSEVGVRQTRSVVAMERLKNVDVENCVKPKNGIVKSSWPIELHRGTMPKLHWLTDDYYEVPFGALVPIGFDNVLVAGRCIDAEHEALASARVTAQCFEYGRAAGIAMVQVVKNNVKTYEIDGEKIAEMMKMTEI